jgi:hypothetical protein
MGDLFGYLACWNDAWQLALRGSWRLGPGALRTFLKTRSRRDGDADVR